MSIVLNISKEKFFPVSFLVIYSIPFWNTSIGTQETWIVFNDMVIPPLLFISYNIHIIFAIS